jgi:BirA family biotin operon repressor/biotin-[acetyl-CoA-carboxylase] ligase
LTIDLLTESKFKECLQRIDFIKKGYFYKEIDSTNSKALELVRNGLQDNSLLLADYQTKGRGRFSRKWTAEKGKSLLFSLVVFPILPEKYWFNLVLISAISIVETLKTYNIKSDIKYPNDIIVNSKKISGVLIEIAKPKDKLKRNAAVIGVGMNVNQDKFENRELYSLEPTSVYLETKKIHDRIKILEKFLIFFIKWYSFFEKEYLSFIFEKYKFLSSTIGKAVEIKIDKKIIQGTAIDIEEDGSLIIRLDSGVLRKISSADIFEIEWK